MDVAVRHEKEVTMGEMNRPERPTPPAVHGSAVLTPPTGLPAVGTPAPSVPAQRPASEPATAPAASAPPAAPSVPSTAVRTCLCGHPEEMHEHYRAGDDCGACGPRACGSFRDAADDAGPVRRVLRRLRA